MVTPEQLARKFHETYERKAPSFGCKTREASAKPWEDVPQQNKDLMIAVAREVLMYICYNSCEHEWIGHKDPNTTDGPGEYIEYCNLCGMENPGSFIE